MGRMKELWQQERERAMEMADGRCELHGSSWIGRDGSCGRCKENENSGPMGSHRSVELSDEAQLGRAAKHELDRVLSKAGPCGGSPLKEGEPTFTFRAQDITAPLVLRLFADLMALNPEYPREKVRAIRERALEMERWPHRKWPD